MFRKIRLTLSIAAALLLACGHSLAQPVKQMRGACPPPSTFCDQSTDVGYLFICTDSSGPYLGVHYVCPFTGAGSGAGQQGAGGSGTPFEKLRSIAATAGDTWTMTSDGVDFTFTPSRAGSDTKFNDQAGVTLARLYDSTALPRGLNVPGHVKIGTATAPATDAALYIDAKVSSGFLTGGTAGAFYKLTIDGTPVGGIDGGITQVNWGNLTADALDGGNPAAAHWFRINGDTGPAVLTGSVSESVVLDTQHSVTIAAGSAPWPLVIGARIGSPLVSGVAPLVSYGLQVLGGGNGSSYNIGIGVGGGVHVQGTSRLKFGQTLGTSAINSFRSLTSTGTTLVMELNSVDEFKWSPTSFFPSTNGGAGLGQNANGFADAWFLDTSAAFEHRIVFTDSTGGGSTADRVLTVDMKNANQTLSGTNTGDVLAGRSLTLTAGSYDADAELYTQTKCLNVDPSSTVTDFLFWRTDAAITVTGIDCLVDAATSLVLTLRECDGNGGSCAATEAAMTCGTTNTTEASAIDDAAIDAGDYIRVLMGTKTGTPTQAVLCMTYTVND